MIIIAVIGLAVIWLGLSQGLKYVTIAGIAFLIIGIIGSHLGIKNHRAFGFIKRL